MRPFLRASLTIFTLAFTIAAHTQATKYKADKLIFKGAEPYNDAELTTVTSLRPGQTLDQDSLGAAAQHLLDTGLFDDAKVTLGGSGLSRNVIFDLKPISADKLLAVSFANLVWFSPDELQKSLSAQVPLYHGAISDAGTMADQIQSALQQLISAKGITATLSHSFVEPTTQHPHRLVEFRADVPRILLGKVAYAGSHPAIPEADLDTVLRRATGSTYNEGLGGVTVEDRLLAPWRDLGYIAARLTDVRRTPVVSASGRTLAVDYTATLDAGAIYKLGTITWETTPLYGAADFSRDNKLTAGEVASAKALAETEQSILNTYRKQGYLYVYLDRGLQLDDATHTVSYKLAAAPGEQYHLKSVTAQNLPPNLQSAFDAAWEMKAGALYDSTYLSSFMKKNLGQRPFAGYAISFEAAPENETHTVNLTLIFTSTGNRLQ